MRIFKLDDEISRESIKEVLQGVEWETCVYDYQDIPYEGRGIMVVRLKNKKLLIQDLGHCSCNGPIDDFSFEEIEEKDAKERLSKHYFEKAEAVINHLLKHEKKREENAIY